MRIPIVDARPRPPSAAIRAVVINSGNANALTGAAGLADVVAVRGAVAGTLQSFVTVGDPIAYVRSDGFNAVVFPEVASHVGELSIHRGQLVWSLGQLE